MFCLPLRLPTSHTGDRLVQVLLPARFLTLTGHWVALLTLMLDRVRTMPVA